MANELEKYIGEAHEKKVPDEQIKTTLVAAGWAEADVEKQLTHAAKNPGLPPPPPPPVPHVGMWTGFLYIIFFISLYILASSIGTILHSWVDDSMKSVSPWERYGYSSVSPWDQGIQASIAAIIVSYPIFTALAWMLKKQLVTKPYVRNLRARKLLIYITLIGTFLIMIGHIIATIYGFLSGSGTLNSFAHLMVTFIVAGSIFGYFLNEVKYDSKN